MIKYSYEQVRPIIRSFGYLNCLDRVTINPKTWFFRLIGHTARTYVDKDTGVVYVYESTTMNKGVSGVQLTLMSDWLKQRKGTRVLYRDARFFDDEDQADAEANFKWHIKTYRGRPYPDLSQWRWRWYLVNAAVDFGVKKLENVQQMAMIFCTQLSAHLDVVCGIIPSKENPSEWEPDDCRPGGRLDKVKTNKIFIGNEIEIYYA